MEEKVSLYDIHEAKAFLDRFEADEDADLAEMSKAIEIQEKNKVNAIASYFREMEMTSEMAEIEAKRLKEIAERFTKRMERLKEVLKFSMEAHGIEKIETEKFRISFRASESIEVDDVEKLAPQFVVTKKQADKKAIKEAIKGGGTLEGVRVVAKKNLQIK